MAQSRANAPCIALLTALASPGLFSVTIRTGPSLATRISLQPVSSGEPVGSSVIGLNNKTLPVYLSRRSRTEQILLIYVIDICHLRDLSFVAMTKTQKGVH